MEATAHREIRRPWGKYLSVDTGGRYQVKRITVKLGGILSLQKHYHRAEHWGVVRGTAEVTRNDETIIVYETESIYLPIGCVHCHANPGKIPLEFIEVQVGSYLGEDDIIRIEVVYKKDMRARISWGARQGAGHTGIFHLFRRGAACMQVANARARG